MKEQMLKALKPQDPHRFVELQSEEALIHRLIGYVGMKVTITLFAPGQNRDYPQVGNIVAIEGTVKLDMTDVKPGEPPVRFRLEDEEIEEEYPIELKPIISIVGVSPGIPSFESQQGGAKFL